MDITLPPAHGRFVVESYGLGRFKVSGRDYEGGVVIFPDRVFSRRMPSFSEWQESDFKAIIELIKQEQIEPDILLFGVGRGVTRPLSREEKALFTEEGVVFPELMSTRAACHSYNVLLVEDRHFGAILLPAEEESV